MIVPYLPTQSQQRLPPIYGSFFPSQQTFWAVDIDSVMDIPVLDRLEHPVPLAAETAVPFPIAVLIASKLAVGFIAARPSLVAVFEPDGISVDSSRLDLQGPGQQAGDGEGRPAVDAPSAADGLALVVLNLNVEVVRVRNRIGFLMLHHVHAAPARREGVDRFAGDEAVLYLSADVRHEAAECGLGALGLDLKDDPVGLRLPVILAAVVRVFAPLHDWVLEQLACAFWVELDLFDVAEVFRVFICAWKAISCEPLNAE